jgi:IclR family transcriptional regulator, KDG regulon repressor
MNAKELRTIKSAQRVLEILEYFDRSHRTATVMDLSRALGYPQSSTSELLRCLTRLGYLCYNRYRRTYSPTARVALLGSWVEPALFRGGAVLSALDRIAETIGETVVLSTAANYIVQHLHVVEGKSEHAIVEHAGATIPLLHSPEGMLLLSSFEDAHVRSALHRLNAEEADPDNRVPISEALEEIRQLRQQGWIVDEEGRGDGVGVVSVLLPVRRGTERLALTVLAPTEVVRERADEIIAIVRDQGAAAIPETRYKPAPAVTPRMPTLAPHIMPYGQVDKVRIPIHA